MFRKGDKIRIKPEYREPGEEAFDWYCADDEEKGRVAIMVILPGWVFAPSSVVKADWIEYV